VIGEGPDAYALIARSAAHPFPSLVGFAGFLLACLATSLLSRLFRGRAGRHDT
jgi:hypothetical protein